MEAAIGRGKAPPGGHIPFTPRAKKVLELSLREALQLKHNYIGTEHILLGLLREGRASPRRFWRTSTRWIGSAARYRGSSRRPRARLTVRAEHRRRTTCSHWLRSSPARHRWAATTSWRRSSSNQTVPRPRCNRRRHRPRRACRKLDEVSTEDTADDTPEQAAARQLELSVTDETVTVVLRDPRSIELGKQIVQLNGGLLTARGPQLDLLSRLWAAVNGWLAATARTLAPPPDVSPEVGEQLFGRGVRSRFRRRKAG